MKNHEFLNFESTLKTTTHSCLKLFVRKTIPGVGKYIMKGNCERLKTTKRDRVKVLN